MVMDQPNITAARKALGRQLAELRSAANLTQSDLAGLVSFSRSSVANIEAGYQTASPRFWRECDEVLGTGGSLRGAHDELEEFGRELHRIAAASAQGERRSSMNRPRRDITSARDEDVHAQASRAPLVDQAIKDALRTISDPSAHGVSDNLEISVLTAYQQQREGISGPLSLVLVGGFAGSGKTEFARFLSAVTDWTILERTPSPARSRSSYYSRTAETQTIGTPHSIWRTSGHSSTGA
ncbi:MAG: helix-turn-helix domain-containing protein [Actinomycetota bacterium]|nr:helix-turn-helix domain-containing protein [Actinomycetota bacterium]